jgi:transcriptional regulator with XRE-family HTH domain
MSFGIRLRAEREARRLTQEQFAAWGGVKRVSQHLYEQDARVPDLNYLLRLQEHGVDIGRLVLGQTPTHTGRPGAVGLDVCIAAFRTVDEFARDASGEPLPYSERERFFAFLCSTLVQEDSNEATATLKERLIRLMSA